MVLHDSQKQQEVDRILVSTWKWSHAVGIKNPLIQAAFQNLEMRT